jgi:rubrerythrin
MAMTFNADEVLAMAEQIERNGRRFYVRAAEIAAAGEAHVLLEKLAGWEEGHEALFASMRSELSEEGKAASIFDNDSSAEMYLQAAADSHVFNAHEDPTEILRGSETAKEILEKALSFERDSILFFVGMSKAVPARLGTERVLRIIDEEMSHVAYLKTELRKLDG